MSKSEPFFHKVLKIPRVIDIYYFIAIHVTGIWVDIIVPKNNFKVSNILVKYLKRILNQIHQIQ